MLSSSESLSDEHGDFFLEGSVSKSTQAKDALRSRLLMGLSSTGIDDCLPSPSDISSLNVTVFRTASGSVDENDTRDGRRGNPLKEVVEVAILSTNAMNKSFLCFA